MDVSMLLASAETVSTEQDLVAVSVETENHSAYYHQAASVESDILGGSIGHEVPGTQNWYTVSGHEDMQYLIYDDNNEYSLWKFSSFQEEIYPYSDVMQIIYNIRSAEDITEIVVAPARMDNTDEGRALQDEIGTSIVADAESIETIYNVLSGLICCGENNWDQIGLSDQDNPSSMLEQVRAGRYLTIVTSRGIEIDALKYTGISGVFYEYGGIAYSALTAEERTAVEEILKIESGEDTGASVTETSNGPQTNSAAQDVAADEELLAVLRAFDTTGTLLEIEYCGKCPILE